MEKFKKLNKFTKSIVGKIMYVSYLLLKEDETKITNFIGLCTYYQKRNGNFLLKNNVKGENINLIMSTSSPILQTLIYIKRYKKKIKLKKL
jgi:ribosomal protein L19